MPTSLFLRRCRELACASGVAAEGAPGMDGITAAEKSDSDSLIGFFQLFRPNGQNLVGLFDDLPQGDQLASRLAAAFVAAGDGRRPQGGKDAFFIVRTPPSLPVEAAEHHGQKWLEGLQQLASAVGDQQTAEKLAKSPKIRILEGIPPKHPKSPSERSSLLTAVLDHGSQLTSRVSDADPHAELLRPAYYFMACDAMLRDYLMWPFYAGATGLDDPLRSYFVLWSRGVKFRIFGENQVDLYLPRLLS